MMWCNGIQTRAAVIQIYFLTGIRPPAASPGAGGTRSIPQCWANSGNVPPGCHDAQWLLWHHIWLLVEGRNSSVVKTTETREQRWTSESWSVAATHSLVLWGCEGFVAISIKTNYISNIDRFFFQCFNCPHLFLPNYFSTYTAHSKWKLVNSGGSCNWNIGQYELNWKNVSNSISTLSFSQDLFSHHFST